MVRVFAIYLQHIFKMLRKLRLDWHIRGLHLYSDYEAYAKK